MPTQVTFKLIEILPRLPRLQNLALSQISLADDAIFQFAQMLPSLNALKKLNISNNMSLSKESV